MADTDFGEDLGTTISVEDKASGPLGSIEASYQGLTQAMDTFFGELKRMTLGQNEAMQEAEDVAEDLQDTTRDSTSRFGEMTSAVRENWLGLDQLGLSWRDFIKYLSAASVGAAIAGVVGFLAAAASKAREFREEFSKLNEVYALSARESREVTSTVLSLADSYGRTRDEAIQLTRAMLDLGLTPKVLEESGEGFKALAKELLTFSSATGVSLDSAADFASQLRIINRVPASMAIRKIGNAIKSVADNSRISSDELVGFNKSLEPIFAVMSDKSGEARAAFTVNMLGLAGALSDVGIDAGKATEQFADMLDSTSESGVKALAQLAQFTGRSSDELRNLIENNPAGVFDEVSRAAAGMSISDLQLLGRALQPLGLEFVDLSKLRKVGQEIQAGGATFQTRAEEAARAAQQEDALAAAARKREEAVNGMMRRLGRAWENVMIQIGGVVVDEVVVPLMQELIPAIKEVIGWIREVNWREVIADTKQFVATASTLLVGLAKITASAFDDVGSSIGGAFAAASTQMEGWFALFEGDIGRAKRLWVESLKGMGSFAWKLLSVIPRAVASAFDVDLDKWILDKLRKIVVAIRDIPFIGDKVAGALEKIDALRPTDNKPALAAAPTPAAKAAAKESVSTIFEGSGMGAPGFAAKPFQVQVPSLLTTKSPALEGLLREQVQLARETRDAIKGLARGASSAKQQHVRGIAGAP